MRFYKSGISPLIASILLISFAVAIGTTIMSFGSAVYAEKRMLSEPELLCRYIELELNIIDKKPQICFNRGEGNIEFLIINKANRDIESLIISVIGNEVLTKEIEERMAPGYLLKKAISYDISAYGFINQVQFIPKIMHKGVQVTCSSRKLVVEDVKTCNI